MVKNLRFRRNTQETGKDHGRYQPNWGSRVKHYLKQTTKDVRLSELYEDIRPMNGTRQSRRIKAFCKYMASGFNAPTNSKETIGKENKYFLQPLEGKD